VSLLATVLMEFPKKLSQFFLFTIVLVITCHLWLLLPIVKTSLASPPLQVIKLLLGSCSGPDLEVCYATISNKTSTSTTVGGSYSSLLGEAVIEYKGLPEKEKKKTRGHFFSKWHLGLD